MRLHVITVGSPKLDYAKRGWDEYAGRLQRSHRFEVSRVNGKTAAAESEAIRKAAGKMPLVLLDPRGKQFSSEELAAWLEDQSLRGHSALAFAIGGPEGHSDDLRKDADHLWSLGKLTLPHDLAMVVLLEALYRALSINAGEPYHRGG